MSRLCPRRIASCSAPSGNTVLTERRAVFAQGNELNGVLQIIRESADLPDNGEIELDFDTLSQAGARPPAAHSAGMPLPLRPAGRMASTHADTAALGFVARVLPCPGFVVNFG